MIKHECGANNIDFIHKFHDDVALNITYIFTSLFKPVQINKWDGSQVKHAMDDAFKTALMDKPNCREHFGIIDGRLFICFLAVAIALFALGYDYIYTFPTSR